MGLLFLKVAGKPEDTFSREITEFLLAAYEHCINI